VSIEVTVPNRCRNDSGRNVSFGRYDLRLCCQFCDELCQYHGEQTVAKAKQAARRDGWKIKKVSPAAPELFFATCRECAGR
jgi:hypothetical protein